MLKVGDQVKVDGLPGRGMITKREGRNLTIQFRSGLTLVRDQQFVHAISGRMVP